MKESMSYESITETRAHCNLCHHQCKSHEGKRGICGVRENRSETLYSLKYINENWRDQKCLRNY
jgi:pyruvate formate lyase activating enzyme